MHAKINFRRFNFSKNGHFYAKKMPLEVTPCQHTAQTGAHGEHWGHASTDHLSTE
jgi:hypothetical protein